MRAVAAVVLAGLLLAWPAALNGYPLLFIDSFTYLRQTTEANPPWDKALVYGPLAHALHWQWSLWPVVLGQALAASWLLWLVQYSLRGCATAAAHLLLCGGLALLTAAPWFLALVMPDALSALIPLALWLLAFGRLSRGEVLAVGLCGTLAIAVHFAHLPMAAALVALAGLLTRRVWPMLRAAAPLALAVLVLGTANLAAFGRFAISPNGSIFLLGRWQEDGPALALLRDRCGRDPGAADWRLCGFLDLLPMDSDVFLWGVSPVHSERDGTLRENGSLRLMPEARAIVAATVRAYPREVAEGALRNTLMQLARVRVGDTLPNAVFISNREVLEAGFPPGEVARFRAGLQERGALPDAAAPFLLPHLPVLLLALGALGVALVRAVRARDVPRAALILFVLTALVANAFATGALSRPHHRYQARLVWLVPAVAVLVLLPRGDRLRPPA